MKRRIVSLLTVLLLLLSVCPGAAATETEPTQPPEQEPRPIYTVEDLLGMGENSTGSYILMEDLDMAGIPWTSMDFSGTFDGNGHAILNLTITDPSGQNPNSCCGNYKLYETTYFGFFGVLKDAEVKNLQLLNVRSLVEWDSPVFLGGIAGYAENAVITDCTVTGMLELRAHDRIFGVGSLVGYGSGRVENCVADMTLINVDTDALTRDEQFMGGIYATGFMDVLGCQVTIDGYVSEHGYVHCGGIVGMYMEYPLGTGQKGSILDNHVTGKITFFEDNLSRRAYCAPLVGEALVNRWTRSGNTDEFLRDERYTYDVELRPEMCEAPVYTEEVTASDCENFGYTTYTCTTCGWSYRDHYTLRVHEVTQWTLDKEPTVEEEGLSIGYCGCGREFTRIEPKLEPEPTTEPTTEPVTEAPAEPLTEAPATEAPKYEEMPVGVDPVFYIAVGSWCVLLLLTVILTVTLLKRK